MKKYLMTGVAALAFAATFTSCSKAGDLYDESKVEEQKIASVTEKYDDAFIKAFGQPAANQDWGFGSRQLPASFGSKTRIANVNGNEWGTANGLGYLDYPAPKSITDKERADVLAVFSKKGKEKYTTDVDFRNFFVQQVYCGDSVYTAKNGDKVTGSSQMQEMFCVTKYKKTKDWPLEFEEQADYEWDYINNTNNGGASWMGNYNGCTLMLQSSTLNWKYKSTQDGGNFFEYWRMEKIGDYYYVGFDFSAEGSNPNQQVDRDLVYDDWIVKIVPGKGESIPEPKRYTARIICEDLMATAGSDFDFNDVVFDASYREGETKTFITIKAAGGTIPLYIEGKEVHELFKQQYPDAGIVLPAEGVKGTMINTHATGGVDVGDVSLTLNSVIAPKDIKITIMTSDGTEIPLNANIGQPTAKIAVDPDFNWLDERDDITKKYTDFSTYVKDGNINWY